MNGILHGIRVLDFGRYIAGPYCAALLAEYGAEVIRIEKRDGGEDRYLTPIGAADGGAMYLQTNRNKLSMTLDLTTPDGKEITSKLVRTADVVVANLPEQALRDFGIDYDSLVAIKPDIILANISTFGPEGPLANNVGSMASARRCAGRPISLAFRGNRTRRR